MAEPRLATDGVVARPRLLARIEEAVTSRPLTLLVAPAGMGKTTAVRSWMASTPLSTMVVDERHDRDVARAVAAALSQAVDHAGCSAGPTCLVVEELDTLPSPARDAVRTLATEGPDTVRVLATARTTPVMGLSRLRAELAVTEIGAAELAFDVDVGATVLRERHGLAVEHDTVERLVERIGGWPAGIELAGLAARSHGVDVLDTFDLHHPSAHEYLLTEFLGSLTPELRSFVVLTGPLEWLTPTLAEVATGDTDAGLRVAELTSWPSTRVVRLASEHRVHHDPRLHDWLRSVARSETPFDVDPVQRRAIAWLRGRGFAADALRQASVGGLHDLVASILVDDGERLLTDGRTEEVRDAVAGLPRDTVDDAPALAVLGARARFLLGEWQAFRTAVEDLRVVASTRPDRDDPPLDSAIAALEALLLLVDGQVGAALRRLPPRGGAPPHGWRAGGVDALRDVLGFLVAPADAEPRSASSQHPTQDVAGRGADALLTVIGGDRERARSLALLVLGQRRQVSFELVPAALALVWTGTEDESRGARDGLADLAARTPWWLPELCTRVADIEVARRDEDRAAMRRAVTRAREHLARVHDVGELQELLVTLEQPTADLTPRERELLDALRTTDSRTEIAEMLFVSVNTVKTHLRSVYRKLGSSSREEALATARRLGLLS